MLVSVVFQNFKFLKVSERSIECLLCNKTFFFLKEIKLDMKEKLLRQEAKEAQILSEKRLTKENLTEQLKLTEETGRREIEKLKMQYAIDHSNSTVAELNGKLKSSELMIERLNQIIGESKGDREKLSRVQVALNFYLNVI